MNDNYNGWSNRETWAANLWLTSDYGLYSMVNDWVDDLRLDYDLGEDDPAFVVADDLANRLSQFFDDVAAGEWGHSDELRAMLYDVGSLWRVDWHEIATNWLEG